MQDFCKMFPTLDGDVIEAVLRAHNGSVDETIDDLLNMTMEEHVDVRGIRVDCQRCYFYVNLQDETLNSHSSGKLVDLPISSAFTPSFPDHIGPIRSIPNPISSHEQAARVNKNLSSPRPAPIQANNSQQRHTSDSAVDDLLMLDIPTSSRRLRNKNCDI